MSEEKEDLFLKYLRKDLIPYAKPDDCCEYIVEFRKENERLKNIIKEVREYIEKLLREETEITDEDNIDYGMKCQRAYFSDSELGKVLEIIDKVNNNV